MATFSGKITLGSNVQGVTGKYISLFIYAPGICGTHRLYKKQVLGKTPSKSFSVTLPKNTYWAEACITDSKGVKFEEGCFCSEMYNFNLTKSIKHNLVISDHCSV